MTATDEPRIHSSSADSRRARRRVEEVSFDELIADDLRAREALSAESPAEAAPKAARTHANAAPAPSPVQAPAPAKPTAKAKAERAEAHHPKGRFYRPELYSTTQRITGSVVVKVTVVVLLLAGTAALVYLALDRFS
ncbi:hypothetical protein ITJ64_00460 [Herbiconiux sp. VKM Ac-1786]|uniref:hypothetical protein n=1 Tax=Herbiconiux sp. VKM Ac-1786 TaxID=2783824 RepID=UPI00188A01D2|nr:hypothetical protein [Herbiconiux sp. VKM Ac-1786]MBF4570984.1 hypothetical protein [Herbiconiux sp. VKM Ac-1786]